MTIDAAVGYMILAAKRSGLTDDQIAELKAKMQHAIDYYTEKEAENAYKSF